MSIGAAMSSGLQAAWLLARGRQEGVNYAAADMAGAARSFWAMAVCLPAFLCLRLLALTDGVPPYAAYAIVLDLFSYVAGWCGFAVLSHQVVGAMGLADRWPRFIVLWNWCNVVQYALLLLFSLPALLGVPALLEQVAQVFAFGWALWLEWFAFRLTLGISGLAAAGLVTLDMAVGVVLTAVSAALVAG